MSAPSAVGSREARVLLANGDEFIVAYLERLLQRLGVAQVDIASTGIELLERMAFGGYDLLLLDLDLPLISGLELLSVLRADPKTAELPIMVATGVSHSGAVQQALALGVSDYILKPFQERVLQERLERILFRPGPASGERSAEKLGFLVADADRVFRETVKSALEPPYSVALASSMAEWMARAAQLKPDYAILEPGLFGRRLGFFLDALKRCCRPREPGLILTSPDKTVEALPEYVGTIEKAFVPETVREAIQTIVQRNEPPDAPLHRLASDLESVTRQALGLMTGVEALPCSPAGAWPSGVVVSITLKPTEPGPAMRVVLAAAPKVATAVTADMAGVAPEDIEPGYEAEGFKEIASLIASRLKHLADEEGAEFRMGLPSIEQEVHARSGAVPLWFVWNELAPFAVLLEECGRPDGDELVGAGTDEPFRSADSPAGRRSSATRDIAPGSRSRGRNRLASLGPERRAAWA